MMSKELYSLILFWLWAILSCAILAGCALLTPTNDPLLQQGSPVTTEMVGIAPFLSETPIANSATHSPSSDASFQEHSFFEPTMISEWEITSSAPCSGNDCEADRASSSSNAAATHTAAPQPTTTPAWPEVCKPFPDHIIYLFYYIEEGAAVCKGEFVNFIAPMGEGSPWDIYPWDYTPRTGRIAFGMRGEGLWVYDFWTNTSTNWMEDTSLKEIRWSPIKNAEGIQPLAALLDDGSLFLISDHDATAWLADAVTHFSWSPDGKKIAYVKGKSLYSITVAGGEARLLARGVFGAPVWAPEDGVIFIVTSPTKYVEPQQGNTVPADDPGPKISVREIPFRIARLDGSGSFVPTSFDGQRRYWNSDDILWVPERNVIVGYNFLFELSDDLKTIENKAFFLCEDMACPFTSILRNGRRLPIHWLLLPNAVNANLGGWGVEFRAIDDAYDPARVTILGEVASNTNGLLRINLIHPDFGSMGYRTVNTGEQTQIKDAAGNLMDIKDLKREMNIELIARPLSENTLSLLAIRIQITEGDHD